MNIPYKDILLWGHSFTDFIEMFALTKEDLESKILDCCGGPDSFNAELTLQGGRVISCDPLFNLSVEEIKKQIETVFADMISVVKANQDRYIWARVSTVDELALLRKKNIATFLQDYSKGLAEHRYQAADLPSLPYKHFEFELALCSHYLFANAANQSVEYHVAAIQNLAYVAQEVRIFPLVDSQGEIPTIVGPVMQALYHSDYGIEIKAVPYQFQKKGNALLRVWMLPDQKSESR